MVFPYNAIAGKDRVLFQTYDALPDIQTLATSFSGTNNGFHGYLGGVKYIYTYNIAPGEIGISLRNIFASSYTGVAANGGNFDFSPALGTICGFQANVVAPAPFLLLPGQVILTIGMNGLELNYFSNNTIIAFPANSTIHFEIDFFRNAVDASLTQVGGS